MDKFINTCRNTIAFVECTIRIAPPYIIALNVIDPFGFVRIDPLEYTKEVYNDFRSWEAIRNLDNLDNMQNEIGIEEV